MTEKEFVSNYIKNHCSELKNFPEDFITSELLVELIVPKETLMLGNELFGNYEIIRTDGSPVLQAESIHKAKYIIYANRNRIGKIQLPENDRLIAEAVEKYETYLDSLLKNIKTDFKAVFPESQNIDSSTSEIFKKLNLIRI